MNIQELKIKQQEASIDKSDLFDFYHENWNKIIDFLEKSHTIMTPEIFDINDKTNSIAIDFLISSIITVNNFDYKNPISVVLTVNGKQASFRDTIGDWNGRLNKDLNRLIEERAKELVKIRTTDKIEAIERVLSKLKESVLDSLRDDGFKNVFDDSDYWNE